MQITLYKENPFKTKNFRQSIKKLNIILKLQIQTLNIQLLTDESLLNFNRIYLNHNYYTDIITFDLRDKLTQLAEIYISIDRLNENAEKQKVSPVIEFRRLLIHGLLHLAKIKDKTKNDKIKMRSLENYYLELLFHVKPNE